MNKNVIVTGGSRGIGATIVKILAESGYNVILNYNKSEEKARQIKNELKQNGINIETFKADVSKRQDCKNLVEYAIKKLGYIDVLVNNAGISQFKVFTDITDEEWNNMIQTNLNSVFYMSQEVAKHMINRKEGNIVNISSIWGLVGSSCEVHYSTSKAAINGMTKALAKELGPSNIKVNSIAPGFINTDMNNDVEPEIIKEIVQETPLGKIGEPIDIAKCVKWLVEDEFTTGQIISPNGGWVIT